MTGSDSAGARSVTIDAAFVGEQNPALGTAVIGNEALLFDPVGPFRIPLNASAALIWACLDGTSTLGAISQDIADAADQPYETVLADVVSVVAGLVSRGIAFVAGIEREPDVPLPGPAPLLEADLPSGRAGRISVAVGDDTVEVRSNDDHLLDALRRVVRPSLAGVETPTHRIALLASPDRGRIAGMYYLYRDDELVLSSASRGRAARMALAQLDAFLPPPPGTVRLDAHVLVGDKGAALVSGVYREMLDIAGRQLKRAGWGVVDTAFAHVDRSKFQVVVDAHRIRIDRSELEALNTDSPVEPGEIVRSGRHDVSELLLVGTEPDTEKVVSPAQRAAALLPLLRNQPGRVDPRDVGWLVQLDEHAETRWILGVDDRELIDTLSRVAGRVPRPKKPLPR